MSNVKDLFEAENVLSGVIELATFLRETIFAMSNIPIILNINIIPLTKKYDIIESLSLFIFYS